MALDKTQIRAVKASWDRVDDNAPAVVDQFYSTLFAAHPEIRGEFPADLTTQKETVVKALDIVIGGLSFLNFLIPIIKTLGIHPDLVGPETIGYIKEGIILTLSDVDPQWSPELSAAWNAAADAVITVLTKA